MTDDAPRDAADFIARAQADFGARARPVPQYGRIEGEVVRVTRCVDAQHRAAIRAPTGLYVVALTEGQSTMFREQRFVALDSARGCVRMTPLVDRRMDVER